MKKKFLLAALISGLFASSSFAGNVNYFQQRDQLIQQNHNQYIHIGWFPGIISLYGTVPMINNYVPFGNYLSSDLKSTAIIVPDQSNKTIYQDAIKGDYDVVYTTVNIYPKLIKQGWIPLAQRTSKIKPVILTLKNSNINSEKDLKGKRILATSGVAITDYIQYNLYKDHIIGRHSHNFIEKQMTQKELLSFLKLNKADGIVALKAVALKFMKKNPNLKIAYEAPAANGLMVLANPKTVSQQQMDTLKNELLGMTNDMPDAHNLLIGLNGYDFKEKPFSPVNQNELSKAIEMQNTVDQFNKN